MTYILLFALTTLMFFLAQGMLSKSRVIYFVLSFAAIFLLSLFAGARDNCIGTDIQVYGYKVYCAAAHGSSFWNGYRAVSSISELFYYALNYLCAAICDKYGFFLFVQTFIMLSCVFVGMNRYRDKAPVWLSMLLFNLFFYNLLLNLMRQGLALCILFAALGFLERQKVKPFLLFAALAFMFHKTAAVAAVIMLAVYFISQYDESKQRRLLFLWAIAAAVAVVLFGIILEIIASKIPVFEHYLSYADDSVFKAGISTVDVFLRLLLMVIVLVACNHCNVGWSPAFYAMFYLIADLAAQALGKYAHFTTRFSYYFIVVEIPLVLALCYSGRLSARTRCLVNLCLVVFFLYYCVRFNYVEGSNETYPYKSLFLFDD